MVLWLGHSGLLFSYSTYLIRPKGGFSAPLSILGGTENEGVRESRDMWDESGWTRATKGLADWERDDTEGTQEGVGPRSEVRVSVVLKSRGGEGESRWLWSDSCAMGFWFPGDWLELQWDSGCSPERRGAAGPLNWHREAGQWRTCGEILRH